MINILINDDALFKYDYDYTKKHHLSTDYSSIDHLSFYSSMLITYYWQ